MDNLSDPEKLTGISALVAAIFGGYWKVKASKAGQLNRIEESLNSVNEELTLLNGEVKTLREDVASVRERMAHVEGKLST